MSVYTDFDLYLYNVTTGQYVYGSQTLDDNNEGFDITFPSSGHYQIWLSWPTGLTGCDPLWGDLEPSALSWVLFL
ncbi:MAG: hypothetical protein IPI67_00485 [Myxococcales bacterium]|nr:hypothetical protein [Myxococcales bacterium]